MTEGEYHNLPEGVYLNLGKKAFWLSFYEKLSVAAGFFILAIGLSFARQSSFIPAEMKHSVALVGLVCWAIFFLSLVYAFVSSRVSFKSNAFCLAEDAFKLKKGVLTTVEIAIPYRQIQNVDIERTLNQKVVGVSKLVITTASSDSAATADFSESGCVLPTIDKEIAENLQAELLRRADVQKTTVERS